MAGIILLLILLVILLIVLASCIRIVPQAHAMVLGNVPGYLVGGTASETALCGPGGEADDLKGAGGGL